MSGQDFLSIADLTPDEVEQMVTRAGRLKDGETSCPLEGKTIALLFEKPSLRTRVSFEVGVRQLGGDCIYLSRGRRGPGCTGAGGRTWPACWRGGWTESSPASSHTGAWSCWPGAPPYRSVNALSDLEHPCQALGDLLTIRQHKGRLTGVGVVFIGDGNNVASSLALACSSVGADFVLACPAGYRVPGSVWKEARRRASRHGSKVEWTDKAREAVGGADVLYTDVWTSMGQEAESAERLTAFEGYRVDEDLFEAAAPDAVFMHDMPAHRGEEVSETMLDHARSVVFDQAEKPPPRAEGHSRIALQGALNDQTV